jgi:hypothetical protein
MTYAVFSPGKPRTLHAVKPDARQTVCGRELGRGTGMMRDGNYAGSVPCPRCWSRERKP